jgi:hypothetical protein
VLSDSDRKRFDQEKKLIKASNRNRKGKNKDKDRVAQGQMEIVIEVDEGQEKVSTSAN